MLNHCLKLFLQLPLADFLRSGRHIWLGWWADAAKSNSNYSFTKSGKFKLDNSALLCIWHELLDNFCCKTSAFAATFAHRELDNIHVFRCYLIMNNWLSISKHGLVFSADLINFATQNYLTANMSPPPILKITFNVSIQTCMVCTTI